MASVDLRKRDAPRRCGLWPRRLRRHRVAPRAITLCAPTRAHRRSPDGTPAGATHTSLAQSPTQAQRSALPPPRSASMHGARTPRPRPGGPRADATTAPTRIAVHPLSHTPAAQTPRGHALCSLHHRDGAPGHTHRELHRPTSRCSTMYDTACLHPGRYAGRTPRVSPGQGPPRARSPPFGRILWRRWSHRGLCCTRCTEGAPEVAANPPPCGP